MAILLCIASVAYGWGTNVYLSHMTSSSMRIWTVYNVSSRVSLIKQPLIMTRFALLTALVNAAASLASPLAALAEPDPSLAFSVNVDGHTFINKVVHLDIIIIIATY